MKTKNTEIYRRLSLFIIGLWLVYSAVYLVFGEKLPVGGGFGWDGTFYGIAARELPQMISERKIQNTQVERLLPSAVVFSTIRLLKIAPTNENIIRTFEFMNQVLVLFSALLWLRIVMLSGLGHFKGFLGTIAIFINFPLLKLLLYCPVVTDAMALFIGFFSLYGYLARKQWILLISLLASTFTWPIAAYTIPFLLIFRRESVLPENEKHYKVMRRGMIFGILAIDLFIYYFFIISGNLSVDFPPFRFIAPSQLQYLNLFIGTSLLNLFLYYAFNCLLKYDVFAGIRTTWKSMRWNYLVACVLIIGLARWVCSYFPESTYISISWYLINLIVLPALQPAGNVVGLIAFFGPMIYLLIFCWNRVVSLVNGMGIGFTLFFLANLVQCLDLESRHLLFFYPFLVFLGCRVISISSISFRFLSLFILISFVFSRAWFRINTDAFVSSILKDTVGSVPTHQRFLMHNGAYAAYSMYLVLFACIICAGWLCYRFMLPVRADAGNEN